MPEWTEPTPEGYLRGESVVGRAWLRLDPQTVVRFNEAKRDPDPTKRLDATCDLSQYLCDCSEVADLVRRRRVVILEESEGA